MKRLIIVAVASTALFSTAAFASDTAQQTFQVNATVAPECVVGAIQTVNLGAVPISTTADADGLTVNADIPKGDHNQDIYLGCNQRMHINFQARGLVSDSNAANPSIGTDGFTNKLNYSFGLFGVPGSAFQGTTNGNLSGVTGNRDPFYHQATIEVWMLKSSNAGRRPLSGTDYNDTAILTLSAI